MPPSGDTTTSASRIVGVASFKRPVVVDDAEADALLLHLDGAVCHVPYSIKVRLLASAMTPSVQLED